MDDESENKILDGTVFEKLTFLDMQIKEAENLHWSAAAAYAASLKDGVNVEENKAMVIETLQAVVRFKNDRDNLVKEIDETIKDDTALRDQIDETVTICDIAMLVAMENFNKTCVATNALRPVVYDQRKGKVSVVIETISSANLIPYAPGITKKYLLQWCPSCGSSRIYEYAVDQLKDDQALITGQVWTCLDCNEKWNVDYRTGTATKSVP